jgi:hypothetical protein
MENNLARHKRDQQGRAAQMRHAGALLTGVGLFCQLRAAASARSNGVLRYQSR